MPAENCQEIARSGSDRRAVSDVLVFAGDGENDAGSLSGYDVGANLVHIKNHTGDVWSGAVLGGSDLAHTIRMD
jgi:hypothetical protein